MQWVLYENTNGPHLWDQVIRHIRGYLLTLWAMWLLPGDPAKRSFVVRCDHTTMTQADTREGNLICLVSIAPVKPSELLHYRIRFRLKACQQFAWL